MHGFNRLTYQDIKAWAELTGRDPQPHEVAALLALDLVSLYPEIGAKEEDHNG